MLIIWTDKYMTSSTCKTKIIIETHNMEKVEDHFKCIRLLTTCMSVASPIAWWSSLLIVTGQVTRTRACWPMATEKEEHPEILVDSRYVNFMLHLLQTGLQ